MPQNTTVHLCRREREEDRREGQLAGPTAIRWVEHARPLSLNPMDGGAIDGLAVALVAALVGGYFAWQTAAFSPFFAPFVWTFASFTTYVLMSTGLRLLNVPVVATSAVIGHDGVAVSRDAHQRFYAYSEIGGVRVDGRTLVLLISGGYAFHVPFRSSRRARRAMRNIDRERTLQTRRLASGQREPADAIEHGREADFIVRQRRRAAAGYRKSSATAQTFIDELTDPDYPIALRLGAALALDASGDTSADEVFSAMLRQTASPQLNAALVALKNGRANDRVLTQWLSAMHPQDRTIAPVMAPDAHRQRVLEPTVVALTSPAGDPSSDVDDSGSSRHAFLRP